MTEFQCQNWFSKFRFGSFHVEDLPHSGRPVGADDSKITVLIDINLRITIGEIAEKSLSLEIIFYIFQIQPFVIA